MQRIKIPVGQFTLCTSSGASQREREREASEASGRMDGRMDGWMDGMILT